MRPRASLAALMGVVVLFGVGFAALRSASVLWASAVFTLTVAVLLAAILGLLARRGRARLAWAGFALFGWAYLLTAFGLWSDRNGVAAPPYVTKGLLDYAATRVVGPYWVDQAPQGEKFDGSHPMNVVAVSPPPGGMAGVGPPLPDLLQFRRIGHCLAALLFGIIGAGIGRVFAELAMREGFEEPPRRT